MGPKIQIKFDKDVPMYKPGEKVSGKVILKTDEEIKIKCVHARYRGKAHNGWYEYAHRAYYEKEEFYMDHEKILFPPGKKSDEVIPAGRHEYEFSFSLPEECPSSFEGDNGWLRYTVFIKVERSSGSDNNAKAAFTVVADMDLNKDEQALIKPFSEITKKVGLFGAKPVTVSVTTNKGGYVPGEKVNVEIKLDSQSDKKVEKCKVFLSQKVRFEGKALWNYTGKRTHEIAKSSETVSFPELKQQQWTTSLMVPSVPPSDLPHCSIISIKYKLKVHVICGDKISVSLPIRIGTNPLTGTEYGMGQTTVSNHPPSYMESMFGSVSIVEKDESSEMECSQYTPLYPYLHFES